MMPDMDGLEVVKRLKADRNLPFIPVIMQTALDSTERMVAGLEAGADDYVTKPINFAELEARVRSLLRIKKLQQELGDRERELSQMNDRLLHISLTDGLTGVDNRRALEQRLHEMFEHSLRLHEPVACVMCDIDHFKKVNDTYGHAAGDEVLKQFAEILKSEAREIDRVGRYGGEEFLLLLPGTVLDSAVTFAERLRQRVDDHTFSFEGGTLRRTMSCGVASWPHPRISGREEMLKAADDALYVAKELGRNRVVRFDSAEFNSHIEAENDADGETSEHGNQPGSGSARVAAEGHP
jgi:diguanylate cyclase (GGDEF)-like protein